MFLLFLSLHLWDSVPRFSRSRREESCWLQRRNYSRFSNWVLPYRRITQELLKLPCPDRVHSKRGPLSELPRLSQQFNDLGPSSQPLGLKDKGEGRGGGAVGVMSHKVLQKYIPTVSYSSTLLPTLLVHPVVRATRTRRTSCLP